MSIMDNQTGSQIMARHGAYSGGGSQSVAHVSCKNKGNKSGYVGGQIDDLCLSCGGTHIQTGRSRKHQDKKRTGARAVKTVISADYKRSGYGNQTDLPL